VNGVTILLVFMDNATGEATVTGILKREPMEIIALILTIF
jgi:hypothetical protein